MFATRIKQTEQEKAIALHAQLATVHASMSIWKDRIPVMSTDRSIRRKEQAALTRKLFAQLGIKGISVTTPNYSMASTVEITIPKRRDYIRDSEGPNVQWSDDPVNVVNRQASEIVRAILALAFPNHNDRSDYQTDYFDNPWSIS